MRAKFHIDAVFTVEGRGTVLQGTVVDGAIVAGMTVLVPELSRRFVVGSVGYIPTVLIPAGRERSWRFNAIKG